MFTDDEKDYIMRMIKEIARVLASVMLGEKICPGGIASRIQIPDFRRQASPYENHGGQRRDQRGRERTS